MRILFFNVDLHFCSHVLVSSALLTFFLFITCASVDKYLQHRLSTVKWLDDTHSSQMFPSITICPVLEAYSADIQTKLAN